MCLCHWGMSPFRVQPQLTRLLVTWEARYCFVLFAPGGKACSGPRRRRVVVQLGRHGETKSVLNC